MADVEALLVPWLADTLNGLRVGTETPADLASVVPYVKLTVIGGTDNDDNPRFELASVVTESFGSSRGAALDLAQQVKTAFRVTLPGTLLNDASSVVTKTQTIALPGVIPYDNTSLRRVLASYRLYVKTRTAF